VNETRDLFIDFEKRARGTDVPTSHAAAASIETFGHLHHGKILSALRRIGDGTFYDIARATGELSPQQVWRRLSELDEKLGLIERVKTPAGELEQRRGDTGRKCCVWRLRK
jgi:DNA-binding HxlR family transcriptional regulator